MAVAKQWSLVLLASSAISTSAIAQPPDRIFSAPMRVSPTRITKMFPMVQRDGLTVAISVVDVGGSTDASPTEQAVLTLYLKGAMFNVDATFDLGMFHDVQSATRIEAGVYELKAISLEHHPVHGYMNLATLRVDARQATIDIRAVDCEDRFDCGAAKRFRTAITATRRISAIPR